MIVPIYLAKLKQDNSTDNPNKSILHKMKNLWKNDSNNENKPNKVILIIYALVVLTIVALLSYLFYRGDLSLNFNREKETAKTENTASTKTDDDDQKQQKQTDQAKSNQSDEAQQNGEPKEEKGQILKDGVQQSNNDNKTNESSQEDKQTSSETPKVQIEDFEYTAVKGDSLHYLVRKSLIRYLKFKGILQEIDNNQKIYIETNVVKALGKRKLKIGEKVIVPVSLLEKWTEKSQKLTQAQKLAWRPYAMKVNYEIIE